jgi:hypothetical protein
MLLKFSTFAMTTFSNFGLLTLSPPHSPKEGAFILKEEAFSDKDCYGGW